MFNPHAYKGRALLSLLAELDGVGDLDRLPKVRDWQLIERAYGVFPPDPTEALGSFFLQPPPKGGLTPDPIEVPITRADNSIMVGAPRSDSHIHRMAGRDRGPDPTERPTTAYRCEQSTTAGDRPIIDLPNVRVDEYIGGGAFGWIYAASIISTGFVVAVKILRTDYADSGGMAAREALMASSLRHAQILGIYDINRTSRYWVIIMELIRGSNFKDCAVSEVASLLQLQRLASALHHMAERAIVHRDIKPGNIVLRHSNHTPVIVDFGLAVNTATYAHDGSIAGTPYFMCPEGLQAEAPSPAFDAYSLGVTYCDLLLRGRYVGPKGFSAMMRAKREGRFEAILLSEIDEGEDERLVHYARRLVDHDPTARTQAIQELASSVSQ